MGNEPASLNEIAGTSPAMTNQNLRNQASAVPAVGDLVEHARTEAFGGTGNRPATEGAIEFHRRVVVRERPDHQALHPALHEIAAGGAEQATAEAKALEFRPQVKLINLAFVVQAA